MDGLGLLIATFAVFAVSTFLAGVAALLLTDLIRYLVDRIKRH